VDPVLAHKTIAQYTTSAAVPVWRVIAATNPATTDHKSAESQSPGGPVMSRTRPVRQPKSVPCKSVGAAIYGDFRDKQQVATH